MRSSGPASPRWPRGREGTGRGEAAHFDASPGPLARCTLRSYIFKFRFGRETPPSDVVPRGLCELYEAPPPRTPAARFDTNRDSRGYQFDGRLRPRVEGAGRYSSNSLPQLQLPAVEASAAAEGHGGTLGFWGLEYFDTFKD